jgi:4-nitrophenyl phosphatase
VRSELTALRAFIFDMDGVIYLGKRVLPGAAEFVARLRAAHIPFLFLTNNSTTPGRDVADRLLGMGIAATAAEIMTSADATAAYLRTQRPGARVLVVGELGIRQALTAEGFSLVADHRAADAVVVGLDREATYARLKEASLAVQAGALFLATNLDASLPSEEGLIPGAGAVVGMVEIASGKKATPIGKPSPGIFHQALARLGVPPEATGCIGDRPDTDILGGQLAGLATIAVLTGVGTRQDFEAMQPPPDHIYPDLSALQAAYFGTGIK